MDIEREDVVEAAAATVPVLILVGVLMVIGASFVTDPGYEATVTVTDGGSPVEDATVTVTADGSYAGTGEYTTTDNGTVVLPAPESQVSISVTATVGDRTARRNATLASPAGGTADIGDGTDGDGLAVEIDQNTSGQLSPTGGQAIVAVLVVFVLLMTVVGIRLGGDD